MNETWAGYQYLNKKDKRHTSISIKIEDGQRGRIKYREADESTLRAILKKYYGG